MPHKTSVMSQPGARETAGYISIKASSIEPRTARQCIQVHGNFLLLTYYSPLATSSSASPGPPAPPICVRDSLRHRAARRT